jgi:hypothetical protein
VATYSRCTIGVRFCKVVDDKDNIWLHKGTTALLEKIEVVGSFPTFQFLFVLLTLKINTLYILQQLIRCICT